MALTRNNVAAKDGGGNAVTLTYDALADGSKAPGVILIDGTTGVEVSPATAANQPGLNADGGALAHVTNFPTTQAVSGSVAVSNLPATQAISAAALPLPAGAATAALQPALNADGGALAHVANFPATQAASLIDGANVTLGSRGDAIAAVASGSAGTFSLISIAKQIVTALLGWLNVNLGVAGAAVSATNPVPIYDAFQAAQTASWTSATAVNTAFTVNTAGYDTVIYTIAPSGTITAGAISFQAYDGTNWLAIKAPRTDSYLTDTVFSLSGSPGLHSWQLPVAGYPSVRALLSTAISGSGSVGMVGIVSSAPDVSLVTVGLDPNQPLPPGTNLLGAVNLDVGGNTISQSNPVPTTETYSNINANTVTVGATATLIVAARAGRKEVMIVNNGTIAVNLGGSGVTASAGLLLAGNLGEGVTITGGAAVYGIVASGTETVSYLEVY